MDTLAEKAAALKTLTDPIDKENQTKQMIRQLQANALEEGCQDDFVPPPEPTPALFYGFVGEVARIAGDGTEVNPVAAALVMLSFLGANMAGDSFYRIGNTIHHTLLFSLHVGRSGRARKGDSQQLVHLIRQDIAVQESALLGNFHGTGLSSREGLAALIHDGFGESPAIADKRLWIIESEFANVLHQSRRDGNTLSSALREAWDGKGIKPATKSKPVGVEHPLIGIHANITPTELNSLLNARDMTNGFANRFLTIWAEKTRSVAYPKPTPEAVIDDLANKTMEILRFAKGGYPNRKNSLEMHFSKEARDFWEQEYVSLDKPLDNDFLNEVLERRATYTIRLAMVFALTDQTRVIEVCHLKAALSWVTYSIASVRYIFQERVKANEDGETRRNAEKIVLYLEKYPEGRSHTDITNDCFKKKGKNNKAFDLLMGEVPKRVERIENKNGKPGRNLVIYRKIGADKFGQLQSQTPRGFQGVL